MRMIGVLLLLLIAAVFAWAGVAPWLDKSRSIAPPVAPSETGGTEVVSLSLSDRTPTDFSALAARPLFSAVRRPPPPETAGEPIADPGAHLLFGRYEVAGVMMLGANAMAMLRDENGALLRLRTGDRLPTRNGTADVVEITLTTLTFDEGGEKVVVEVGPDGSALE